MGWRRSAVIFVFLGGASWSIFAAEFIQRTNPNDGWTLVKEGGGISLYSRARAGSSARTSSRSSATSPAPVIASLQDARGWAWVMEPAGTASRHFAEQLCRSAGFEPDVRYETADLQTHIRLVESGNAVALLPDLLWAGREVSCTLLPLAGHPHRTIFTAQREAGLKSPAVEAVRATLESAAARF